MARDCTVNRDPNAPPPPMGAGPSPPPMGGRGFDSEYASLLAELGETPANAAPDLNKPSWQDKQSSYSESGLQT
jgi:splicing factor 1